MLFRRFLYQYKGGYAEDYDGQQYGHQRAEAAVGGEHRGDFHENHKEEGYGNAYGEVQSHASALLARRNGQPDERHYDDCQRVEQALVVLYAVADHKVRAAHLLLFDEVAELEKIHRLHVLVVNVELVGLYRQGYHGVYCAV